MIWNTIWDIVFAVLHLLSIYFIINDGIGFYYNYKVKDQIIDNEMRKKVLKSMIKNLTFFSFGLSILVTLYVFNFIILG